jgi:hypothetical protein
MAAERKYRTTDEIVMQMIELAEKNYKKVNEILASNNF